jgi:hypothetical protein
VWNTTLNVVTTAVVAAAAAADQPCGQTSSMSHHTVGITVPLLLTTPGVAPFHRPRTPLSFTTADTTARALL